MENEKTINIMIEEYKMTIESIKTTSNIMTQTAGVFLTFSPVAIAYSMDKIPWVIFLFQALTLLLLLYEISLDRDISINSAYAMAVENNINSLLSDEYYLNWQKINNYVDGKANKPKKNTLHNFGFELLLILFGIFYGFTVYQGCTLMKSKVIYILISGLIFFWPSFTLRNNRDKIFSDVLENKKINKIKQ